MLKKILIFWIGLVFILLFMTPTVGHVLEKLRDDTLKMRLIKEDDWGVLTLFGEARGEPYESKVAIAEIIRKRTQQKYFSDGTIAGTVLHDRQFSSWNSNDPNRIQMAKFDDEMPSAQECMKAWYDSVNTSLTQDALLYFNPRIAKPNWNFDLLEFVVTIGQHDFYRLKGSAT